MSYGQLMLAKGRVNKENLHTPDRTGHRARGQKSSYCYNKQHKSCHGKYLVPHLGRMQCTCPCHVVDGDKG